MKIIDAIANILRRIEHSLFAFPNEPLVEQKNNRDGSFYWEVRDRKTNKSYTFGSDTEVRIWIEKRYRGI